MFEPQRLTIRTNDGVLEGAEISLDGKPLHHVMRFEFRSGIGSVNVVTISMVADIECDAEVAVVRKEAHSVTAETSLPAGDVLEDGPKLVPEIGSKDQT